MSLSNTGSGVSGTPPKRKNSISVISLKRSFEYIKKVSLGG